MKKKILVLVILGLCMTAIAGCSENRENHVINTETDFYKVDKKAYDKLVSYKVSKYQNQTVADFNMSLLAREDDLADLYDAQSKVIGLTKEDENYEFIMLTLTASLDEMYTKEMGEQTGYQSYAKKYPSQKDIVDTEEDYIFNVFYFVPYTIMNQKDLTVKERDAALVSIHNDFQEYVEALELNDIEHKNIRDELLKKGEEIVSKYSSDKYKLSFEIMDIEFWNSGTETRL